MPSLSTTLGLLLGHDNIALAIAWVKSLIVG